MSDEIQTINGDANTGQTDAEGRSRSTADPSSPVTAAIRDGVEAAKTRDFEHRRLFAAVNRRLFGHGELLRIGRFRVLRRLGAGGMGEVYLCEDDELGRRVAVKRVLGEGSDRAHERLRREAQALAKVRHANVVHVYEVGEHEGRVFLVMEYIEGETARKWLKTRPSQQQIFEHFVATGRGLAAIHTAGLVHRDFKPNNVLIDGGGRAQIVDFGLALTHPDPCGSRAASSAGVGPGSTTRVARRVSGTWRYMAIEQLLGLTSDARSDQFSYCLAFYEALWGEAPFADTSVEERRVALELDKLEMPVGRRDLFRVISRGLARDPTQRWPSMDALIDALESIPTRRRRRKTGIVVGLSLSAIMALTYGSTPPGSVFCEQGVTNAWDPSAQTQLEQHVETLDASHVPSSAALVVAALNRWKGSWDEERESTCEQLRHKEDALHVERARAQAACLTRQSQTVAALLEGINDGDADTLAAAVVVLTLPPDPKTCAEALTQGRVASPPLAIASLVEAQRAKIDKARQLRRLGHYELALTTAKAAEAAAVALDYAPLLVEARAQLAMAEDEGGSSSRAAELYDAAIKLAEVGHREQLAAKLLIERAELSLLEFDEYETATLRLERAETASERAGLGDSTRAHLEFIRGRIEAHAEDYARARANYQRATELAPEVPQYLEALAGVTPDIEEALELRNHALRLSRQRFGALHPQTAKHLYNHASALTDAGQDGAPDMELAVQIWTESPGGSQRWRAKAEQQFAAQAIARQDLELAQQHAQTMANILDDLALGEHPIRGEPELLFAQIDAMRADADPAHARDKRSASITHARLALRHLEAGPAGVTRDPRITGAHLLLGNQLMSLGQFEQAQLEFDWVLEHGQEHPPDLGVSHLRKAELALRRGELTAADAELRQVTPHVEHLGHERPSHELLRALVDLRLDQVDDRQLQALPRICATLRARDEVFASALVSWLAELGASDAELERLGC